jgi:predicted DsbA family dithiol-disulfide isomerase
MNARDCTAVQGLCHDASRAGSWRSPGRGLPATLQQNRRMRVDIWSDIVCPWCYVGKRRFETAVAAFDAGAVEVVHHAFQLNPAAPREKQTSRREMLMQKYGLTEARVDELDAQMTQTAAEEGLEYRLQGTVTGNTLDAHQLVHLAKEQDRQDAMLERLYRAYFSEARSVFDPDSLIELTHDVGLDRDTARTALLEGRYVAAVRNDIELAQRIGISGVPFFVIDGRYGVSGAQPPAAFLEAFATATAV